MIRKSIVYRIVMGLLYFIVHSPVFASVFSGDLRDPTRPPSYFERTNSSFLAQQPVFVLNATLISQNREIAVINGQPFQVGDEVGGNHILLINSNTVQLVGVDGKITLFLIDQSIKSTAKQK